MDQPPKPCGSGRDEVGEGECSQDLSLVFPESQPSQEAKAIFQYEFELLDWDLKVNKSCCSGEEAEAWPRTPVREQPRDLSPAWKEELSLLVASISRPQSRHDDGSSGPGRVRADESPPFP